MDLRRRVVADARAHGRWEEAFELSHRGRSRRGSRRDRGLRGSRAARARSGRDAREVAWGLWCSRRDDPGSGPSPGRTPHSPRGDVGRGSLGARHCSRLTEGHPDYAWGCNVPGRALHFTSQAGAALDSFKAALSTARTDEDVKDALWGQFLAITEIAPEQMQDYLDELESRFSDDLDVRLRLAVGRYGTAEQTPSIAGEWNRFAVLLDSVKYSRDPLASTSFLAMASVVARFAANYSLSRDLADRTVSMCRELRFDLGLGASLLHVAAAELGLRLFGHAQRNLSAFQRTLISREDPFYRVEALTLTARLRAYLR